MSVKFLGFVAAAATFREALGKTPRDYFTHSIG
jgi:hypothetical protein